MSVDIDNLSPSHYVGIGASAGGLEALQEFFTFMPSDLGVAFIVVQHLSPDFKSMMPELLKKHTKMPIVSAVDGLTVKRDEIYLMPARTNMSISDGKLVLAEKSDNGESQLQIDMFLSAMASDQKHRAVGIVLSGTGSDGTRGIKALKERGGLVIVQEPSSAKFDGMPISAYNTGLADMLLPPKEIGSSLAGFVNHPLITNNDQSIKSSISENTDLLSELFQLLKEKTSINFALYKASTVARRIERRMGINQLASLERYMRFLRESSAEVESLGKELLIGVTSFFRDDDAFGKLSNTIIPRIVERAKNTNQDIRLWVAGCSSGEEAYSIAIILDEEMRRQDLSCHVKIFATDVDEDAISFASSGNYPESIIHEVSPERLKTYFTVKGKGYVISKHIRQMVIFAVHNLIEDAPFSNVNLVSCRNVLIYFQHGAQKRVLSSIYFALEKSGFLFLGSSESLGDLNSHFTTIDERLKLFKKLGNSRVPIASAYPLRDSVQSSQTSTVDYAQSRSVVSSTRAGSSSILLKIHERIIKECAPSCIVLNDALDAIHVYGSVSIYTRSLQEGKVSNNISDIVTDNLGVAISTALHRCQKTKKDVFYKDIDVVLADDSVKTIDLSIFLVKDNDLAPSSHFYIVQFISQDEIVSIDNKAKQISFDPTEQTRQRIKDLEQELLKKKQHLQITVEELETTNEELQSANEELMSANEELQSTNEELQSVNEELYTVNSEYQEKIFELTEANDDLDGIINVTDLGIVFLDKDLEVRKYTPIAKDYFNVRDQDIGRPFEHISHRLVYDDIVDDLASVNDNGKPLHKEVLTKKGDVLSVKLIPYKSVTTKNDIGLLVIVNNISHLKFVEESLHISKSQLRESLTSGSKKIGHRVQKEDNLRVLVLDDNAVDCELVNQMLSDIVGRQFHVNTFTNVGAAVKSCKKESYDVFLVDYDLGSGQKVQDFVEQLPAEKQQPLIVLSGYSEEGLDADFLNNKAMDFLKKDGLNDSNLIQAIDYTLERKKLQNFLGMTTYEQETIEA